MARVAEFKCYQVMKAAGPMSSPTFTKIGKGFRCDVRSEAEARDLAEAKAKRLAEAETEDPTARFYVMATVAAYRAPARETTHRSY